MADSVKRTVVLFLLVVCLDCVSLQVMIGGRSSAQTRPMFIVTSPTRARFDTETIFSVSASNVNRPATISLSLRTGDASEVVLNTTTLRFSTNGVQTWGVVVDSDRMTAVGQRSVQLRAQQGGVVKVTTIPMNPLSGYIMVQTDKVIYTPRQTVMFRVIALDDDQRFARWPITVDIKNPDLVILERQHHSPENAFKGKNFTLPNFATPGKWSITAYYEGSKVRTTETVYFEVEEYVLPTFKVEVESTDKVIDIGRHWIQIKVKALYAYGEPVHGRATLKLGVFQPGTDVISLFNVSYEGELTNGVWSHYVPVADLSSHSAWFPDGSLLYLSADVTEAGTGEEATGKSMDTFFANPYYQISFAGSKKYFRPGFGYTLVVDVKKANQEPAVGISVYIMMDMTTEDGQFVSPELDNPTFPLDDRGRMSHTFNVPPEVSALRIHVYTLDPAAQDYVFKEYNVGKFASPTNSYIHLDEDDGTISVSYTPPSALSTAANDRITVLVMSRGRMVYHTSVPRDGSGTASIRLTPGVLVAASPSARVIAYYYIGGLNTEIVSDSLFIDTDNVCKEEVSLNWAASPQLNTGPMPMTPRQRTELVVSGGGQMKVGLLAVDKAVYFLRDKSSLTRDKIFNILANADEGSGVGDGENAEKIFEYAGLQYMKVTEAYEATRPITDNVFDISRLEGFLPDTRAGMRVYGHGPTDLGSPEEEIPVDKIRNYFPESWLFKEITLSSDGYGFEDLTLPDSITTWSFTAVGVGHGGGVCMSRPLEVRTFKPFFLNVRLPYKAVRLEEVDISVGVYNYNDYPINVTVTISGDLGICFTEGYGGQQRVRYSATVPAELTQSRTLRIIPLVAGEVKVRVIVRSTNGVEQDAVEKTLHVVAEGRRVQKSITFPLDPSGEHSSHQAVDYRGIQETSMATITNTINSNIQKQITSINLFLPEEVVQGSMRCQISACGDLMGDIITTAVLDGDNLFESTVVDAEEAIGNLAPAVYALSYLNISGFMSPRVEAKGRAFVVKGVSRLLTYRKQGTGQQGSYGLTPKSPPATWLTALVLKTLCHAEEITFIDRQALIGEGFAWLLDQVRRNGTLREQDRRLARPSVEYDMMLSAEALIALLECSRSRPLTDDDLSLMAHLEVLLQEHVGTIRSPLVMAKATYALTLTAPRDEASLQAVERLSQMRRVTADGLHYWSVNSEGEPVVRPFWYHSGSKASSVEATAYALLVFSRQTQAQADYMYSPGMGDADTFVDWSVNLDAIAGWLIQKRNSRGAFIGAMDTAAATQALSEYSLLKKGLSREVNLHCNVTSGSTRSYSHTFDFNEDNAMTPKSLSNVPVGQELLVVTQGSGLGQMQVQVEYNVPQDANAQCQYNVTTTLRHMSYDPFTSSGDPLQQYCNMGHSSRGGDDDASTSVTDGVARSSRVRPRTRQRRSDRRGHRSRRQQITVSRVSICMEVCLRSSANYYADRTYLTVNMLTGFEPYREDLQRLIDSRDERFLSGLIWLPEKAAIEFKFTQVPHDSSICLPFRAAEIHDVQRRNPAHVTVRSHEDQDASCVHTYHPIVSEVNLEVYCANNQTNNQGQCRCISGLCGTCLRQTDDVTLTQIQTLVCESNYIYKIRHRSSSSSSDWTDIIADVIEVKKSGDQTPESQIEMVAPFSCRCPLEMAQETAFYFFGKHVDIFVDRNNRQKRTYLLDHTSTFIGMDERRVTDLINMSLAGRCPN